MLSHRLVILLRGEKNKRKRKTDKNLSAPQRRKPSSSCISGMERRHYGPRTEESRVYDPSLGCPEARLAPGTGHKTKGPSGAAQGGIFGTKRGSSRGWVKRGRFFPLRKKRIKRYVMRTRRKIRRRRIRLMKKKTTLIKQKYAKKQKLSLIHI